MSTHGPPPIPADVLKLRGTYRKWDHADRGSQEPSGTKPLPLNKIGCTSEWMWQHLMQERPEWLESTDTTALQELCDVWELLCETRAAALVTPYDKDVRIAFTSYHAMWEKLACQFGLTPSARARLGPSQTTKEDDDLDRLLA